MGRAVAIVVVTVLMGAFTALPTFNTRFLGIGGVDHFGTLWFHAEVRRALQGDPGRLLHTPDLYFPWGMNLLQNTGSNVLDGLLAAPFHLLGAVSGHNLFLLAVLVANGGAAAWYARDLGARHPWIAGVAFALAPYPLYELVEGRPAQALLVGFIGFLRSLERAREGRGSPAIAGLWLAALGYQYWFYGIFAGLMAVVAGVVWIAGSRGRRVPVFRSLLTATGVALLLTAPVVLPLLRSFLAGEVPGTMTLPERDLLLHSFQPLLGKTGYLDGNSFIGTQRAVPLALLLALIGLRRHPAALAMGTAMLILAAGPLIVFPPGPGTPGLDGGAPPHPLVPSPLYDAVTIALPPLQRLWHPSRAIAGLAVVGIIGLAHLRTRWQLAILVISITETVRDGLVPLPTWDAAIPAGYRCLGGGGAGAIVELPFGVSQRHLWYQTGHGRPILGGMHEGAPQFQPGEAVALREGDPFLAALIATARTGEATAPIGQGAELHDLGYRYVVLQKDELPSPVTVGARTRRRRIEQALGSVLGPPLWDDARTAIWAPWGDPPPCGAKPPTPDGDPGETLRDRRVQDLGSWAVSG